MSVDLPWLLALLLLLLWGTIRMFREIFPGSRVSAFVLDRGGEAPEPLLGTLAEQLRNRARKQGLSLTAVVNSRASDLFDRGRRGSAHAILANARAIDSPFTLAVAICDFSTEPLLSSTWPGECLRVYTTICVSYRLLATSTGLPVLDESFAICRVTVPIVRGTMLGAAALKSLSEEIAARIVSRLAIEAGAGTGNGYLTDRTGRAPVSLRDSLESRG